MIGRRVAAAALLVGVLIGAGFVTGRAASISLTSQTLTPYRTCTLTATPAAATVQIDTTARQGSATTNFGTLTTLTVSSASAANQRTYLRFDLTRCSPAIPATAIIRLATLRLFVSALPAVCRTVDLFRSTATWTEAGLTWNNQPFGAAINNPATASRTGTFDVGTPVGCQNRTANAYVVGGTVTTDVAAFVAGSSTNFGWMLRDDAEGSATARTTTFSAKNLGTAAQGPQLVITYVAFP
ncbi:MAG TPA: DNRLRE domain-containing protein [Candidatus Limnocylindria bacterium]